MRRIAAALLAAALLGAPAEAAGNGAEIVRPGPSRPWNAADARALRAGLARVLNRAPALRGAHVGVLVASADDGRVLFERGAGDAFQPASTLKLLVGSVALGRLGPDYRFRTTLLAAPGALILVGGGDPLFGRAEIEAAAEAARAAGVAGPVTVTIDDARVAPEERRLPGWSVDDVLASYAPVITGLPYEENVLAAWVVPGAVGDPPAIVLPAPFVPIAPAGCRPAPLRLTFTVAARTVAAGAPETLDAHRGRCGEIVITGDVPAGPPVALDLAVDEPEALALAALIDALARRGIAATPAATDGPIPGVAETPNALPPGAVPVWSHDGVPLARLLAEMWLPSDNFIAEELLRELDAARGARPARVAGALTLERAWLREIGIAPAAVTLADGSGLSQYNRITPRVLAAILRADWTGGLRDVVLDALPVAGVRGTQGGRMRGTPAAGRVFAKDGAMSHVRGLAGYVASRRHGALLFVLAVDDWLGDDAALNALRAAFCSLLAVS